MQKPLHGIGTSSPMVVTLCQQYNAGKKPSVMLYTYINRHAGTPDKNKNKIIVVHTVLIIMLPSNLMQYSKRL